jgi:hypothetical protein
VPNASVCNFFEILKFWRASQGSNLEPSDLESDALPIGATDPFFLESTRICDLPASLTLTDGPHLYSLSNFTFFMYGVGAAFRTEFLDRKLVGLRLLVLGRRVVARLAGFTRKRNQVSHYNTPRDNFLFTFSLTDAQIWKAHDGIRTRDLFLTKEVLYRLSYMGIRANNRQNTLPIKFTARYDSVKKKAGNGTRTRDPELGRLALYQLSYSRTPYPFEPIIILVEREGFEPSKA